MEGELLYQQEIKERITALERALASSIRELAECRAKLAETESQRRKLENALAGIP